ncbi:hypothetical protein CWATWH8502_1193 [Crocosphaera watsonii WH 8502]|uniref:Uncharacterized protein n=4 Tax=Crocosphaera watsonii TaxID=263511 RepID=T2JMX9_CROWT|nr:hypothetical protein [Crocosphaera watsonii]EHJ14522.1 hypothetical protein CWATWH0003_0808 [Crocosphaera watsonii WH 0003]CCQ50695.1 hypothetical protein CWATWH8502_1193 [Crocosphaera watsonii WH 8502]CCQ56451.1 hypothetical protein CWATWH0005_739 [Crocosphaera watsonii WH 0005]CCQ66369.1 hypothetical protein CWATWH0402_1342 [Crocosphaera watsonii WH 0402]
MKAKAFTTDFSILSLITPTYLTHKLQSMGWQKRSNSGKHSS